MAYFADLTRYEYFRLGEPGIVQNIGWLDAAHEFSTGPIDAEILARLEQISCYSANQSRGRHFCDLCFPACDAIYRLTDKALHLGSAEIRVFSPAGEVFAAPTLLLHYITVHNYLPPPAFLMAVRNGPVPPMPEYFDRLKVQDSDRGDWGETMTWDGPRVRRSPMPRAAWLIERERS
jgi:hypothetical protein